MLEFFLALLTTATVGVLLVPLLRRRVGHTARLDNDLAIYRDQLGELEREQAEGALPEAEARAARTEIERHFTLHDSDHRTGGPARYYTVEETGGRLGFITPLTHNFCESCNRVRLTCTGTLYMCLGQDDAADLRAPLRASESDQLLDQAITDAIARKPKGHDFIIDRRHTAPAVRRHMSVTGG